MPIKDTIDSLVISAATHGNEMSGIAAIEQWQQQPQVLSVLAPSANIEYTLVNQKAMQLGKRFIDQDLNRQFTLTALNDNQESTVLEHKIAQAFNQKFGPKLAPKTDFIIDIHNTTSNMGPVLIILVNDSFHQQLARFVKQQMPSAIILIEDYQHYAEFGYLCTVAKRGVMIEVGPQAQGLLKAKAYTQTMEMAGAIVSFIEHYNNQTVPQLAPVEAFRLGKEVSYPCAVVNKQTVKTAMIHESLEGQDFCLLKQGDPCFYTFEGESISWQEPDTYPHFIGEAAYNHLHIAFATSQKCLF